MYNKLKQLCKEKGTNVTNLCELVTGSSGNLATWKKGYMRSDYLMKAAEYLGVTSDYLLGLDDVPNREEKKIMLNSGTAQLSNWNPTGYTDCYVAYLDILGFKDFVFDFKNTFDIIYNLFNEIKSNLEELHKKEPYAFLKNSLNLISFSVFSDTIILAIPKNEDYSLETLFTAINSLTIRVLLNCGLLLRGAIAEGDFYIDNDTVFGSALIEAYLLGEKKARYPRIILPYQLVKTYVDDRYSNYDTTTLNYIGITSNIVQDSVADDSYYILDYIGNQLTNEEYISNHVNEDEVIEDYNKLIQPILKKLHTCCNKHILEKYVYFAKYCNNTVKNHHISTYIDIPIIDIDKEISCNTYETMTNWDSNDITSIHTDVSDFVTNSQKNENPLKDTTNTK